MIPSLNWLLIYFAIDHRPHEVLHPLASTAEGGFGIMNRINCFGCFIEMLKRKKRVTLKTSSYFVGRGGGNKDNGLISRFLLYHVSPQTKYDQHISPQLIGLSIMPIFKQKTPDNFFTA